MGLTSLDLDEAAVRAYLAFRDFRDERTAFVDVRALRAGHGMTIDGSGRIRAGRWFRPERLIVHELDHEEAVGATREAVTEAVRSRVLGGKVGLLLSAGRDSGSIAVALRDVGVMATCFTQRFDPDLGVNEEVEAKRLANECGHVWEPAPVPSAPVRSDYLDIPRWAGTPFAYAGFPQETAPIDLAASLGVEVLLNGLGGEPLFSASPAVVFELLRRGHVSEGLEAARTFDRQWTYPVSSIVKASAKTLLPRSVLQAREEMRRIPPWVLGHVDRDGVPKTVPRNEREHLLDALRAGGGTDNDLDERLHRLVGMESAAPLLDLRVIQVAVSLAPGLRAPVPEPKPILAEALLGSFSVDRRKVSFQSYYRRLARSAWNTMAEVYGPGSRLAAAGLIDPDLLRRQRDRWPLESLTVLPVEMWLAHRES
jgi:asparagine synthetase B (glutamine-hydrolysing)